MRYFDGQHLPEQSEEEKQMEVNICSVMDHQWTYAMSGSLCSNCKAIKPSMPYRHAYMDIDDNS